MKSQEVLFVGDREVGFSKGSDSFGQNGVHLFDSLMQTEIEIRCVALEGGIFRIQTPTQVLLCHRESTENTESNGEFLFVPIRSHHASFVASVQSRFERMASLSQGKSGAKASTVKSQMPGKILKVHVKAGDEVVKGTPLLVMEAMKMENEIKANAPGVIASIHVEAGQVVETGVVLLKIEGLKS